MGRSELIPRQPSTIITVPAGAIVDTQKGARCRAEPDLLMSLPTSTLFWLFAPAVAMFLIALVHSLKHWNRRQ